MQYYIYIYVIQAVLYNIHALLLLFHKYYAINIIVICTPT